jgi:hypothetical protein
VGRPGTTPAPPHAAFVLSGGASLAVLHPGTLHALHESRITAVVAIAWRHFPDPAAHPRAAVLALAAEAAAAQGRFWAMTRELLSARHHDPAELSAAMVRAGLDPARTLGAMRAGTGADRIVADAASALARTRSCWTSQSRSSTSPKRSTPTTGRRPVRRAR